MDGLNTLWQKYLRGELSPEEAAQLLKAMEKNENRLQFSHLLEKEWDAAEKQDSTTPSDQKLLEKIRKELGIKHRNSPVRKLYRYTAAACLLILLGLGAWWVALHTFAGNDFIRLEVAAGQPASDFTLPDSSVVWLNSATVLEYREDFAQAREIKLKGEAYFKVAPDRSNPFRVKFRDNELLVTGTRFIIKAYGDENVSRVNVEEGSVKVFHDADSTSLQRNNKLVIDERNGMAKFSISDFAGANSWKDGLLSFRNISLGETLNALERYYDIHIDTGSLSDETIKRRITAMYPPGTPLEDVIEGLGHLQDLNYEFTSPGTLKIYNTQEVKEP